MAIVGFLLVSVVPSMARAEADPFVWTGSRAWDVAELSSEVIGTAGPLYRFNVKTELDVAYDADQFAAEALAVLSDQRSWIGTGSYRFQLVAGGSNSGLAADAGVDFTLYLATPATVDALCSPLRTVGRLSCRNGNRVVENFHRWMRGPDVYHDRFDGALDVYRNYLINHEVGHRIGKGHQNITNCRPDRYAPVMMQQTFDVRGCAINGWPAYDLLTVGNEPVPAPPPEPPSGPCDSATVYPWSADDRPLDDAVIRLYQAAFGRVPDATGLTYWIDRRATGLPLESMAEEFLASSEGAARFSSVDDADFLDQLYENVLGRIGDEAGVSFWLGLLADGTTRAAVLTQFAESPENVTRTGTSPPQPPEHGWIGRLYTAVFERAPDCEGARYWLWVSLSKDEVVDFFIGGPEFDSRYGNTTDAEFVTLLYRNMLDREPDDAGRSFWLSELGSGRWSRADILLAWLDTPEYVIRTGTTPVDGRDGQTTAGLERARPTSYLE